MRELVIVLVAAAIITGLGSYNSNLRSQLTDAQAKVAALTAANKALADEYAAADAAYQALIATTSQIAAQYRPAIRRVQQAPAQDDAPVAPVLRQALEDLP
jgi:peptide methionine sulfoxide reductase mrsA